MDDVEQYEHQKNETSSFSRRFLQTAIVLLFLIVLVVSATFSMYVVNQPPATFPVGTLLEISEGFTVKNTAQYLETMHVVRSATYLEFLLSTQYKDAFIQAGEYLFEEPLTAKNIAESITSGTHAHPLIKMTFYEGVRGEQIASIYNEALGATGKHTTSEVFDAQIGFLFPDTYFVGTDISPDTLATMMHENYQNKIESLRGDIEASPFTETELITLASIIEREANTPDSMATISGILQKRLEIGMPLQVDATLDFLLDKTSAELTEEDLNIDSPYNTYEYKGLPPTPIANPGLTAIKAALFPKDTDYLYYITGDDGKFYYAKTFEEHKLNKERHLK